MAKILGQTLVLQKYDGVSAYDTVGNLRSGSVSLNNEPIDVTDADSAGFNELAAGVRKGAEISFTGLMTDAATHDELVDMALAADNSQLFKFQNGTGNEFTATFYVTNVTHGGSFDGEVEISLTLTSSGAVTYATEA